MRKPDWMEETTFIIILPWTWETKGVAWTSIWTLRQWYVCTFRLQDRMVDLQNWPCCFFNAVRKAGRLASKTWNFSKDLLFSSSIFVFFFLIRWNLCSEYNSKRNLIFLAFGIFTEMDNYGATVYEWLKDWPMTSSSMIFLKADLILALCYDCMDYV